MAVLISDTALTALADSVRAAAGTTAKYTPAAMAEQLNSLTAYRLWTRPDEWPQYDKYCKRFGQDVLYLTCTPTDGDSTVTFYVTTTDSGTATVEIGLVDEDGFTATDSVSVSSGGTFSEDLGTDSTYVSLRVTADTGGIACLYFSTSATSSTTPVVEVWGRVAEPTMRTYMYAASKISAVDVIYGAAVNTAELFNRAAGAEYINVKNLDTSAVTSMSWWFYNCTALTALDVSGWDTSSVTTLYQTFYGCSSLTALDVSGWDTSLVTTMLQTFYGCSSLTALDVSGWDTSSVTTMYRTFYGCSGLTALDVSGWDTSSVTTMQYTFYGCSSLTALDVSGWDTSLVTSMYYTFYGCSSLTEITGIENWNTAKNTTLFGTFHGCSSLTALDLSGWDTSLVANMSNGYGYGGTFGGCTSLVTLNMGGCDLSNCTNISGGHTTGPAFGQCYALTNFTAPSNIKVNVSFSDCTLLTVDSLNSIIAGLYDYSDTDTTCTLTIGSTNLAKLTDDEIAVATAKGWTVA